MAQTSWNSVLVSGQAKSGTTALFFKVKNALPPESRTQFEPQEIKRAWVRGRTPCLAKILVGPGTGIDYECVSWFDEHLCIVRDPRDRFVSMVLFSVLSSGVERHPDKEEELYALLRQKEKDPASVSLIDLARFLHIVGEQSFSLELWKVDLTRQHTFFFEFCDQFRPWIVKYEDVIEGHLGSLEEHLGVSLSDRSDEVEGYAAHVPRTRGSGDWKNWFLPEDVEYFREICEEYMRRFGYEPDWSQAATRVVPPEHCSEYIARLVARQKRIVAGE